PACRGGGAAEKPPQEVGRATLRDPETTASPVMAPARLSRRCPLLPTARGKIPGRDRNVQPRITRGDEDSAQNERTEQRTFLLQPRGHFYCVPTLDDEESCPVLTILLRWNSGQRDAPQQERRYVRGGPDPSRARPGRLR